MLLNIIRSLIILLLLISCDKTASKTLNKIDRSGTSIEEETFHLDTILEENTLSNLDLNKHQLFIDTSRGSHFLLNIKKWLTDTSYEEIISDDLNYFSNKIISENISNSVFPKRMITIRKKDNEFILYDRCDGIEPRFELRDSAFIQFGVHEITSILFQEVIEINEDRIELKTVSRNSDEDISTTSNRLTIEWMEEDNLYKITIDDQVHYVVDIHRIDDYDVLTNYCPINKVVEYLEFDAIDSSILLEPLQIELKYQDFISNNNLNDSIAESFLKRHFKAKGVYTDDDIISLSEADDKLKASYNRIHAIKKSNSINALGIIEFWLGPPGLNGHCFQPSKALVYYQNDQYVIDNVEFIPDNYVIDSVYVEEQQIIIEKREYDCGAKGFLEKMKIKIN